MIADIQIPEEYKDMLLDQLNRSQDDFAAIRNLHLQNRVPPALLFDPVLPGMQFEVVRRPPKLSSVPHQKVSTVPQNLEEVAFYSVRDLAELVRTKKISSAGLTDMYLQRLKRYNPMLRFAITLTEERARAQAREADREIATPIAETHAHAAEPDC